ncbi:energy transducer TonB [Rasiella sp. SM2506]|uniref:energy transducer TonB n=1 Tax=Rasiella sp. SM2506 TaxID=3423914 RepID=UPI003D79C91B
MGKGQEPFDPKYDIEYVATDPLLEEEKLEELMALSEIENSKIETNRAYNEAEEFLKKGSDAEEEESFEEKLAKMDAAIDKGLTNNSEAEIKAAKEKMKETFETSLKKDTGKKKSAKGSNRRTTISYSLKDRTALELPNPVYTCDGGGKIVISIEVNALGRITNATYNKGLSTTTNGCLIDSALEYTSQARFTTLAGKDGQVGTISYNFPGQN